MPQRPFYDVILALLVATAFATAPAVSRPPSDSQWQLHPPLLAGSGARP